jgi:signal transduction histidine kinase
MSEPIEKMANASAETERVTDQLVELSAIAGGLAHEIRNALSTLRVNLQLLDEDWRDLETDPSQSAVDPQDAARRSRQRIATVLKESQRLETILEDFLEFVRKRELRATRVDLNEVAGDVVEFFRPQAERMKIELTIRCDNGPVACEIDVSLVKQAILNVLINAQQAMTEGGRIMVSVAREDASTARLEIADTGPGIDAGALSRVFEAYYSTKRGGSGLGLAMTRRIVRAHGGTIRAASVAGEGSRFTFRFPTVKGTGE